MPKNEGISCPTGRGSQRTGCGRYLQVSVTVTVIVSFRLEHADRKTGLHVSFNKMAPPITLEEGTYSPWNSQNTLFHYRAFFTMFLPTTVAFR